MRNGAHRIDLTIETTEDGPHYGASIWTTLVRPTRIETLTAEGMIEAIGNE